MSKLKVLSGKDLIDIFSNFGFHIVDQTGSHIKMRCHKNGNKQTLTIPLHKELDKGLLKGIFTQGSIYISEKELHKYFYTE
ncbi:MAG: type II toxin-antitoxin system HicA family toxin [Candidatus Paceibacterota bacterium]|jgi:predicted RNA binding protein YcfA (HicA-like mRNA interferase family)